MQDSDDPRPFPQLCHRQLIGLLGLVLPLLLYVVAGLRPIEALPNSWKILDSVSVYYYTGAVGPFVGVLFALGFFLLSYQGYKTTVADRVVGRIGGFAALGVALFPARAPDPALGSPWWRRWMEIVHFSAAVALFVSFIVFALWLFRKSKHKDRRTRPTRKKVRDGVCLACGLVMIAALAWALIGACVGAPIFLPESIAIVAFAVSWLTKGRVYRLVLLLRCLKGREIVP